MAETFAGKYTEAFLRQFADKVKGRYAAFDEEQFMRLIQDEHWEQEQLKQRIRHISVALHETLPQSYREALDVLGDIAPQCRGVEYLFFPDFVEMYGLDDWEVSIAALARFTPYSSSEFAVRPFILADPDRMMKQMLEWTSHSDHHVRRLASEGCRPRLPWAMALHPFKVDPSPVLPVLERLKEDESDYVRKSVANNLNDIAKDHPEVVKDIARRWHSKHAGTDWILKHGCRGLLRKADPDILFLFGFPDKPEVTVTELSISEPTVEIGDTLNFTFAIRSTNDSHPQRLRIEYAIDFMKANGKTSRKLFKVAERDIDSTELQYTRAHSFKDLTTRKHYPGKHRLSIVINGVELRGEDFCVNDR
ncbi:DNA alkylation repair protein [Paenibacillus sp. J5C_2022]|uniref:DNA alkylation repair protein n=1 Tax=Paenibacillus sp. J5C2022 TaxID=2977129 RepID=UPI0021CF07C0|nr:DNA alkylation repair protein [Paenibacillus sp. J5C2022]MCU6708793.1 DNA alkylation repair protein [Paenibacillus sp. J5C2022]